jgi:hypothetical protein
MLRLPKYGICIVNNFTHIFDTECKPNEEQRDYILRVPQADTDDLFEGTTFSDILGYTALYWPSDTRIGIRYQLKKSGHSGKWGPLYVNYKKKFRPQLDHIIQAMFPSSSPAALPENWKTDFNSIVGGMGYQHPHSDHARAGSYKNLSIFPFVGLHGFNLEKNSLWLLPPNSECGFLNTFEAHQILFIRGDQTHAGVPSQIPRGHMEFFPLPDAGYERQNRTGVVLGTNRKCMHSKIPQLSRLAIQTYLRQTSTENKV